MHQSLERSWQLYRFRRFPLALEETVKFLSHHPESAEAHCLCALIHGKEKRQAAAIAAAESAIRYSPDWSYPHYVHGLVAYWFNQYQPALMSLSEALRIQPGDPDFYEIIAAIHAEQGHIKTSLTMAEKGLEQDAQHIGCLYRRGVALFDLQRMSEAEEAFRAILAVDADHAPSQGFIGHFLVLRGQYVEALPLLRNALRDNPVWTLAQNAWKESLRGQYTIYGIVGRVRQWIIETYRWRCFAVVFGLVSVALYFYQDADKRGFPEFLILSVIIGSLLSAGILFILVLALSCYLGIVSRIIFFLDADIRKTFSWRHYWSQGKSEGSKFVYGIIIFLVVALILRLFRKD